MSLVIAIAVVGILLFCINSFVPMESRIKSILNITVILVLVVWILRALGVLHYLERIHF